MIDRVRLIDSVTGEVLAEGVRGTTQYDREIIDCPVTRTNAMTEGGIHVRCKMYYTVPVYQTRVWIDPPEMVGADMPERVERYVNATHEKNVPPDRAERDRRRGL